MHQFASHVRAPLSTCQVFVHQVRLISMNRFTSLQAQRLNASTPSVSQQTIPSWVENMNDYFQTLQKQHSNSNPNPNPNPNKNSNNHTNASENSRKFLIFDIDGTLVNIEKRLALAPGKLHKNGRDMFRNRSEWDIVLNGDNYYLDEPIIHALSYLKHIEATNKYNIIYLSGRRDSTLEQTKNWLFNRDQQENGDNMYNNNNINYINSNDDNNSELNSNVAAFSDASISENSSININIRDMAFPFGYVIHRPRGIKGSSFKYEYLMQLQEYIGGGFDENGNSNNIIGYFGDRLYDDCYLCIKANIRPILVVPNNWLSLKHLENGLQSVMDVVKDNGLSQERIDRIIQSKWYNMPYNDLIPNQFAIDHDATVPSVNSPKLSNCQIVNELKIN